MLICLWWCPHNDLFAYWCVSSRGWTAGVKFPGFWGKYQTGTPTAKTEDEAATGSSSNSPAWTPYPSSHTLGYRGTFYSSPCTPQRDGEAAQTGRIPSLGGSCSPHLRLPFSSPTIPTRGPTAIAHLGPPISTPEAPGALGPQLLPGPLH